jgi:asparagine synthase (glutamine-hydrolysing)
VRGRIKRLTNSIVGRISLLELSPEDQDLIKRIRQKKLTYLSYRRLKGLVDTYRSVENSNLSGILIEAGCALGGSSILISTIKTKERPFFVYDVFGMIPPPTEEDTKDVHERYKVISEGKSKGIGDKKYYGYEENLYKVVQSNFIDFGIDIEKQSISLIKGLVQDTLDINQPVAFAHIDVDWYKPVMTCLERIFPNLISGGSIILDDYYDWGGCRKATDEYLKTVVGQYILDSSYGSLKIIKS